MTTLQNTPELVAGATTPIAGEPQKWGEFLELPCELSLDLAIPHFTVRDLLRLEPDGILETKWANGDDVPVQINGQLIAWAEFEVFDSRLALRITEWA